MAQQAQGQLKLGAILGGVGVDKRSWRDPALPGEAPDNRNMLARWRHVTAAE
jgi:hypothetical protein